MKLFGRRSAAILLSHTNAHLTSELLSEELVPKRGENYLTILSCLLLRDQDTDLITLKLKDENTTILAWLV